MKMEKYIESELYGIFQVKLFVKNMVLGYPGTHFIHVKVNSFLVMLKICRPDHTRTFSKFCVFEKFIVNQFTLHYKKN